MVQPNKVALYNQDPTLCSTDSNLGVPGGKPVPRQLVYQGLHSIPAIGLGYSEIVEVYIQMFYNVFSLHSR